MMKKQVIAEILRKKTGVSLAQYAKNMKISRQSIYDSIKGGGSRRIRVQIALDVELPPSEIWFKNPKSKTLVDDFEFLQAQR